MKKPDREDSHPRAWRLPWPSTPTARVNTAILVLAQTLPIVAWLAGYCRWQVALVAVVAVEIAHRLHTRALSASKDGEQKDGGSGPGDPGDDRTR